MICRAPPLSFLGRRILIVEDEMLVSMLLEDLLRGKGYEIVGPAARLGEAVDLATTEAIDAALLDLNIGGKEVYPVAEILTRRRIPFAFVSGYDDSNVKEAFQNRPTLKKPFHIEELGQMMGLLLKELPHRTQDQPRP